jgi:hypothetical protein
MKFSTFIIIALLALIAYALWRPPPSPTAMQEILRVAKQWIPPQVMNRQASPPEAEPRLPAPDQGGQESPPANPRPNQTPKPKDSSRAQPHFSWDPFANGDNDFTRKQYSGRVREHLNGDCLLIRCGTQSKDSGPAEEYVLAGFPGAESASPNAQIDFYAYSAGSVTYGNETETKTVTILVYSGAANATNQPPEQNQPEQNRPPEPTPQPASDPTPTKPGSWMWQRNSPLDRGAFDRK